MGNNNPVSSPCIIALPLAALKPELAVVRDRPYILHHSIAACGIETCSLSHLSTSSSSFLHHSIAACGIETSRRRSTISTGTTTCIIALPLAALKLGPRVYTLANVSTCIIALPLAALKRHEYACKAISQSCIIALPLAALKQKEALIAGVAAYELAS